MVEQSPNVPRSEQLVYQLPWFIRRRLGLLSRYKIPYDQTVRMRLGESTFMLADAADIHDVLVTRARNFVKTPNLVSEQGRKRAGRGLLTSTGDQHQQLRRALQPLFVNSAALPFAAAIQSHTEKRMSSWRDQQPIDISREMTRLGLEILIRMVFGSEADQLDPNFAEAITERRRYNEYVIFGKLPFRTHLPTPTVRKYRRAIKIIDKEIYRGIRERRRSSSEQGTAHHFLSLLSNVQRPDGTQLSDEQVRDEVLTLTTAGYETVADGLSWTLYLLAKNPDIQEMLRDEIAAAQNIPDLNAKCLTALPMTYAAVQESWRIYPPTWIYVRTPLKDETLPSGIKVPASSRLYLCPFIMHRYPAVFPKPEQFDPNRFAPSAEPPPRSIYFPFGDGPHLCIGAPLARLESVIILSTILARFRIHDDPNHCVKPFAGVTLRPANGVKVHLESL